MKQEVFWNPKILVPSVCALLVACGGGGDAGPMSAIAGQEQSGVPEAAQHASIVVPDDASNLSPPADSLMLYMDQVAQVDTEQVVTDVRAAPLKTVTTTAVATADIISSASASKTFATQQWGNVQCAGQIVPSQTVPETGLLGTTQVGGSLVRFGKTADAQTLSRKALKITLDPNDELTAGSHRCEIAFPGSADGGIPRGQAFWHAFSVKIPDWRSTTDEQALAQWHAGDTSGGMLPVYTLLVRGNTIRLVLRYDSSAIPSRTSAQTVVAWSMDGWTPGVWMNFVTQALISTDSTKAPFVKTWMNGKQIVAYSGPVGYNQPTVNQYAKHGIYHWVDEFNPWDMTVPTRSISLRHPVIVRDVTKKYTLTQVTNLLTAE